jgi:hypothetical protein
MLKLKHTLLTLFLILFLVSCTAANNRGSFEFSESSPVHGVKSKRFIVKSAGIRIEVSDPEFTANEITALIKKESGIIEYTHNRDQELISMTVKIPETRLDFFISQIESKGKLLSKSINSRDVTEETIDIKARLKNLISLREKFRSLLVKAQNVIEILAIEKELSRIQSELDSIEGRKKLLQNQVSFSRVDIAIERETIYGPLGYLGKGIYWVFEKLFVIQ